MKSQERLSQLQAMVAAQQERLDQLSVLWQERNASIEQIDTEERRLRDAVTDLSNKAHQAEEISRKEEEKHKLAVGKLIAKELELRGQIDQLEICLKRLQDKIEETTR